MNAKQTASAIKAALGAGDKVGAGRVWDAYVWGDRTERASTVRIARLWTAGVGFRGDGPHIRPGIKVV